MKFKLFVFFSFYIIHRLMSLEVVNSEDYGVQFIEFEDLDSAHCIAIYGNVVISDDHKHTFEKCDDGNDMGCIARVPLDRANFEAKGKNDLRNSATAALFNKFTSWKNSQGVHNAIYTTKLWNDMYAASPDGIYDRFHSPEGKGVTTWIKEFEDNFQAVQKTLSDMPINLKQQLYDKIFQQIAQELPHNQEFAQSIEGIVRADLQEQIDMLKKQNSDLQKQINDLKSLIH